MAAPISLMDLKQSFPINYSVELDYSPGDLKQKMEEVATFVSKVYAQFPRSDLERREQLKKDGIWFSRKIGKLPPESECEQFERSLKERIITDLTKKSYLELSTHYRAEGTLETVADPIFKDGLRSLFPDKICTRISLRESKIDLNMRLKGFFV